MDLSGRIGTWITGAESAVHAVVGLAARRAGWAPRVVPFFGYTGQHGTRLGARVVLARPGRRVTATTGGPLPTLRRFLTAEVPHARVDVEVGGSRYSVRADRDGYLDALVPVRPPSPGWSPVRFAVDGQRVDGQVLVPDPAARIAVVSDLDDTVVYTGITRLREMLRTTFLVAAADRLPLPGVVELYRALCAGAADAGSGGARPVFYVSTSPWNLFPVLVEFLTARGVPLGPLLLTDWGPGHGRVFRMGAREHKAGMIDRLLADLPVRLLLVGDSGQEDARIYAEVVRAHPGRVLAVYIRQAPGAPRRAVEARRIAAEVSAGGVPMLVVDDSVAIAEHAAGLGLLDAAAVARVRAACAADREPGPEPPADPEPAADREPATPKDGTTAG